MTNKFTGTIASSAVWLRQIVYYAAAVGTDQTSDMISKHNLLINNDTRQVTPRTGTEKMNARSTRLNFGQLTHPK